MSSNTTKDRSVSISVWVSISIWGISIRSIESISLWLGISRSLAIDIGSASITGGLRVWSAHSGPVGVGIVEGRGGDQDTWVSLSRDADSNGSSNLEKFRMKY